MDRRRLLKTSAVAAAAWTAPQILTMEAAAAAVSCVAPPGGASFQSLAIGAPGASAASYPWVVNLGDATEMTIALVGAGTYQQFGTGSGNKTSVQQNTGGLGSTVKYWRGDKDKAAAGAGFIPNGAMGESVYELRFSQPVCNLAFLILDCDQSLGTGSEWTDQVVISPFVGAVAVAGTFTPSATTKITPNTPQTGSSVTFTGSGTTNVGDGSADANIAVSIPGPVDLVRISHRMAMPGGATTGDRQHVGISDVTWG